MKKLFYILIFFLALGLRTYRLDWAPSSLSNDEISIAYDSYSILHTLKDEHGIFLPLSFKSHSTYKAPMAGYLGVISNYLFGNNEFAARINSAILGSVSVILLGLLAFKITNKKMVGYTCSLVLALTPWHIYTSRMILESNIALFFLILGLYLFFSFIGNRRWSNILFSAVSFGLSVWSYHTEWLLVPLIMITLLAVYRFKIKTKYWLVFLFTVSIVCLPIFTDFLSKLGTTARANSELYFKESQTAKLLNSPNTELATKIKLIVLIPLTSYLNYLDLRQIFYSGLSILTPEYLFLPGLVFIVWLPYLFVGIKYTLLSSKGNDKYKILLVLFLLMPVVPSITQGGFSAVRYLPMLGPMTILISIGVWRVAKSKYWQKVKLLTIVLLISQIFYFSYNYYVLFPKVNATGYQYGYKQIADYINKHGDKYERIIVHDRFGPGDLYYGVPHLYVSYFTKANPLELQKRIVNDGGLLVGNNLFKTLDWKSEKILPKSLYFVSFWNRPKEGINNLSKIGEILYPDGEVFYNIYESI